MRDSVSSAFLGLLGSFPLVVDSRNFFPADAVFGRPISSSLQRFCRLCLLHLRLNGQFLQAFHRRFSSCWIFFFNFFNFMIVLLLAPNGDNDWGLS